MSIHDDAEAARRAVYDREFDRLARTIVERDAQVTLLDGDLRASETERAKLRADIEILNARIKELEGQLPPTPEPASARMPVSVRTVDALRVLLGIPASAKVVQIDAADKRMLAEIVAANPAPAIIALPERAAPWLIDSSLGFPASGVGAIDGPNGTKTPVVSNKPLWFEMLRMDRVIGFGPGTVIDLSPSSWSAPPQPQPQYTYTPAGVKGSSPLSGAQNAIAGSWGADAIMGNFTMRARALGGVAFSALKFVGANPTVRRVLIDGAWRGHDGKPNGETAAVNFGAVKYLLDGATLISVDGPSPVMVNSSPGGILRNLFYSKPNHGMLTYWRSTGVHEVEDFELNAVRMGINLEQPRAGFDLRLRRGTIRIPAASNAFHLNGSNETASMKVHLGADVKVEGGPFPGKLVAHMYGIQTGTDASGKPIFAPAVQRKSDITWDGGEVVYVGEFWAK